MKNFQISSLLKINIDFLCSLLCFYSLILCAILESAEFQQIAILFAFCGIVNNYIRGEVRFVISSFVEIAFIAIFIGGLLNSLNSNYGIGGLFVFLANVYLSFSIIRFYDKFYIHIKLVLYFLLVYLFIKIFVLLTPVDKLYFSLSKNYPGFLIVIFSSFFLFSRYHLKGKVAILPLVFGLFITFFLDGRTSLGLMLGLFILAIVYFILTKDKIFKFLSFVLVVLLLYYIFFELKIVEYFKFSRLNSAGLETSRYDIWKAYINNISFVDTFFGFDPNTIPLIKMYGGNPHNSFFKLHSRVGVFAILFYVAIFAKMKFFVKNANIYKLILLIILSIRLFFDSDCFIGPLDFMYFTILLIEK